MRRARRMFIVTESLFSMDGDRADLPAIAELKQRYGAVLYVDEVHAVGVRGARGLGLAEEQGVLPQVDVLLGTFGKALASSGAYAIVASPLRDYLINAARSLIFTTAMPPVMVWWTLCAVRHALEAHDRRAQLRELVRSFRQALGCEGEDTHIVPFIVGQDSAACAAFRAIAPTRLLGAAHPPADCTRRDRAVRFSLGAGMGAGEVSELARDAVTLRESL